MGARLRLAVGWTPTELDYDLPPELIAQHPAEPRDGSRLLVYDRATGRRAASRLRDLPDVLAGELVVVNDTRVVPARLRLIEQPGAVEVLLLEPLDDGVWEALARPSRRLRAGERLRRRSSCSSTLGEGRWRVQLDGEPDGEMPLPPYIHEPLADPERYQTVYARRGGLGRGADRRPALHARAARAARRRAGDAARRARHVPAADRARRSRSTSSTASATRSRRRRGSGSRRPSGCSRSARRPCGCSRRSPATVGSQGRTTLFVTPGFEFRRVDALLTNFHLPRSTLLALVMAFAGVEETRDIYRLRSRSAIASTRSATRCWSCDRVPQRAFGDGRPRARSLEPGRGHVGAAGRSSHTVSSSRSTSYVSRSGGASSARGSGRQIQTCARFGSP